MKIKDNFFEINQLTYHTVHAPVVAFGVFGFSSAFIMIKMIIFCEYIFSVHSLLNKSLNNDNSQSYLKKLKVFHISKYG